MLNDLIALYFANRRLGETLIGADVSIKKGAAMDALLDKNSPYQDGAVVQAGAVLKVLGEVVSSNAHRIYVLGNQKYTSPLSSGWIDYADVIGVVSIPSKASYDVTVSSGNSYEHVDLSSALSANNYAIANSNYAWLEVTVTDSNGSALTFASDLKKGSEFNLNSLPSLNVKLYSGSTAVNNVTGYAPSGNTYYFPYQDGNYKGFTNFKACLKTAQQASEYKWGGKRPLSALLQAFSALAARLVVRA